MGYWDRQRINNERYRTLQMWIAALITPFLLATGIVFLVQGKGAFVSIWFMAFGALSAVGGISYWFRWPRSRFPQPRDRSD